MVMWSWVEYFRLMLDKGEWESAMLLNGDWRNGHFLEATSDAERGPFWEVLHRRKGIEAKGQTNVKYTDSTAVYEWKAVLCVENNLSLLVFSSSFWNTHSFSFNAVSSPLYVCSFSSSPLHLASSLIVLVRGSAGVSCSIFTSLFSTGLIRGC